MVLEQFIIDADIIWDQVGKTFFENPEAKPGRIMRVQVVNAGIVEDLTGYTLNLGWTSVRDPSKFGLDAFDDVDITKGIFEIEYTSGMLTNIGPLNASLQLVPPGEGRPIESNNFKLTVKNSAINAEAIQGESSFTALEEALVKVNSLESTYAPRLLSAEQQLAETDDKIELNYSQLNARVNETIANAGDGTIPTELADIRVNYEGDVFGTAGSRITNAEKNYTTGFLTKQFDFEVGGIHTGTGVLTTSSYAIRTKNYLTPSEPLHYTLEPGVGVWVISFTLDEVFIGLYFDNSATTSGQIGFEPNMKYKIVLRNKDSSAVVSVDNMKSKVLLREKNKQIDVKALEKSIAESKLPIDFEMAWRIGGIHMVDGSETTSAYAIRTFNYHHLTKELNIFLPHTIGLFIVEYTNNKTYIGTSSIGRESDQAIVVPPKTDALYKFVLFKKDITAVTNVSDILNITDFYYKLEIASDVHVSNLKNKKINVLADSVGSTDYVAPNWWQMIASETGAVFNDYAWSGTTLAHTADRHLWGSHFSKLPDGTVIGGCMVERYVDMDETADGVLVFGSRNDGNVPRGAWDSTDDATFFGALNVLMTGLLSKFKGKSIIFMTPIQSGTEYIANVPDPTSALIQTQDSSYLSAQLRAEAIKLKCAQYGLTCIDLYNESGINGADGTNVYYRSSSDLIHPSSLGQLKIKKMVQPVLEDHI